MITNSEFCKSWMGEFRKLLHRFADHDYQERNWVRAEDKRICDCYTESICFFDDVFDPAQRRKDYLRCGASVDEIAAIQGFWDELSAFEDSIGVSLPNDKAVINHPRWARIEKTASELIQLLDQGLFAKRFGDCNKSE